MSNKSLSKRSLKEEWTQKRKKSRKEGGRLVFRDQKRVGSQIVDLFKTKVLVTLCAPPQWGKTGVSLYVSYKLSLKRTDPENVFFVTAMSDKSWLNQTKGRVLPMWVNNVFHRNTLHKLKDRILLLRREKKDKNILIIVDECHIANKIDHTLGQIIDELNFKDPSYLQQRNIKLLQISATPSNALIDAQEWGDLHGRVCPRMSEKYVSFQTFIDEDRIRETYDLRLAEQSREYIDEIKGDQPMYHFVRSVCNGSSGSMVYGSVKQNLKSECLRSDLDFIELNMTKSLKEIKGIYEGLDKRPTKHTLILIKNMLGASKTISDKFIGSVHESVPMSKSYSSEVQGLPGRMCGFKKRRGLGEARGPLIFCNKKIIVDYMTLYLAEFDFLAKDLIWIDSRLKVLGNKITYKESYLSIEIDGDVGEDRREGDNSQETLNQSEIRTESLNS
jgi:hypothetical protein